MKPLFIHHTLFRILSPVFTGTLVYLLILLINNNVTQLKDYFLGEELYLCIGLSFVIQEFSRLLVLLYKKINTALPTLYTLIISIIISLVLCFAIVSFAIEIYFKYRLGYTPNASELWMFNCIFGTVTLIYVLLHISHQYLYKRNSIKLNEELLRKQSIEDDFMRYKKNINPQLLYDSLESIIILMKKDLQKTDELINSLAETYRYILANDKRDLVEINEEISVLKKMEVLLNSLPFNMVNSTDNINSSSFIIPGTLLNLFEKIVRKSIRSNLNPLEIILSETESHLALSYSYLDKINESFSLEDCKEIQGVYDIYSTQKFNIEENEEVRTIYIPKLKFISSA